MTSRVRTNVCDQTFCTENILWIFRIWYEQRSREKWNRNERNIVCRVNAYYTRTSQRRKTSSFSQDKRTCYERRLRKNGSSSKKSRAGLRGDYISRAGRTNLSNECTTICQPNLSRRSRQRLYCATPPPAYTRILENRQGSNALRFLGASSK